MFITVREQVNDSAITDQTNYTVTGLTSSTDYTFTVKQLEIMEIYLPQLMQ
jgi:hypothetical protein